MARKMKALKNIVMQRRYGTVFLQIFTLPGLFTVLLFFTVIMITIRIMIMIIIIIIYSRE
jgi:hypothetical protein